MAGKFKECKAVGWYMDDFGRAQVSINLTNYKITPPHLVFDECCRLATELGAWVTGSELVGLIPLEALLQAGKYYLKTRVLARTLGSNSYYITADSQTLNVDGSTFDTEVGNDFSWDNVSLRGSGSDTDPEFDPKVWDFSKGSHLIKFQGRERDTWLDSVQLLVYHPADSGGVLGCIEQEELMDYIKLWKKDSTENPMWELMEGLGHFTAGTGC